MGVLVPPGKKEAFCMKLRKLLRRMTSALVAGAMALSLSLPALAETWNMSNYEGGNRAWIEVYRYADNDSYPDLNGQFVNPGLPPYNSVKDDDPVFMGRFETLYLSGHQSTTANATLQDAHIEYAASSNPTLATAGSAELTLRGSNTVTHTDAKPAVVVDDDGSRYGQLTLKGDGSLTVTAQSTAFSLDGHGALDVAGGTVNVTTTGTTGIRSDGGSIQVSGGKLDISGATCGIQTEGSQVLVDGGTLDITATQYGINPHDSMVHVRSGALTVSGIEGIRDTNNGRVQVDGGTLDATGSSYGINVASVLLNGGTLTARVSEKSGNVAILANDNVTVNGGVLNVENNAAPYGILSTELNVTGGRLDAKGQTVVGSSSVNISGGVVHAGKLTSSGSVNLSGSNVTLKSVPTGTVTFSGRARLTIEDPVSENEISALVTAFQNVQNTLYDTAYLKYKPADTGTLPEGATLDADGYVVLRGTNKDPDPGLATDDILPGDISDTGSAPAGDVGGALAAVAVGGAAIWGGYEVATRVILHNLLPEGAAIPKTQAELALLLWNTAGSPEPVSTPAFADVDDATARAAQWCTEQGYLSGEFKPEKHVAKYNVIRAWNKAFPKAK